MKTVIAIVPQLPPAINGLGDYGLNLARQLYQDFSILTHFVVGDPTWSGPAEIEKFPIYRLSERSIQALINTLSSITCDSVLLHYVGYGYAKRGCPYWLVNGLIQWRSSVKHSRLVTMFHEIHATSTKPWRSTFWLSGWQKQLARNLSCSSDHCVTSRQAYATTLRELSGDAKLSATTLPIFSTIGEPTRLIPISQRPKRLVIFGSKDSRTQVYIRYAKHLEHACDVLQIQEIYDIGIPTDLPLINMCRVKVQETGILSAEEIGTILQESVAGFLVFPTPEYYAKSSVFAAYCAHGVLPITTTSPISIEDGLTANTHYWVPSNSVGIMTMTNALTIAENANLWYRQHSLPNQAKKFAEFFA